MQFVFSFEKKGSGAAVEFCFRGVAAFQCIYYSVRLKPRGGTTALADCCCATWLLYRLTEAARRHCGISRPLLRNAALLTLTEVAKLVDCYSGWLKLRSLGKIKKTGDCRS